MLSGTPPKNGAIFFLGAPLYKSSKTKEKKSFFSHKYGQKKFFGPNFMNIARKK
jgi:hypothetical protein